MKVEISNGDLVDKLSILGIKMGKDFSEDAKKNIEKEYNELLKITPSKISVNSADFKALLSINSRLWDIENEIRELTRKGDFSNLFIELARSIQELNGTRANLKKGINEWTNSKFIEEKNYSF
tara:strand:- start:1896 stop:2264 length:369 start_codon:yes stop_codon:yes gene_type:complete